MYRFISVCFAVFSMIFFNSALAATTPAATEAVKSSSISQDNKSSADAEQMKVNINTADAENLQSLKGVGTAKAQAIVEYRTQHGPFKSAEDLSNVKGFTANTVAALLKKNPERIVVE